MAALNRLFIFRHLFEIENLFCRESDQSSYVRPQTRNYNSSDGKTKCRVYTDTSDYRCREFGHWVKRLPSFFFQETQSVVSSSKWHENDRLLFFLSLFSRSCCSLKYHQ